MGNIDFKIVYSSRLHKVTILFSAVWIGLWVLCKRFFKGIFYPNSLNCVARDSPPICLVDSSLGQHKYIKLKGTKFHYVEAGPPEQPVILLLHGFPDCWLTWRYQIPIFSQSFRVIALDLKGFGDSEKPKSSGCYRIELLLDELEQFIPALGVSYCSIIGHDLGALLGWFLVHKSPQLVDRFVSVSCPHPNVYWQPCVSSNIFNSNWIKFAQVPYLPEKEAITDDLKIISDVHQHLEQKDVHKEYLEACKYSFSRKRDWIGPINYFRNLPFVQIREQSQQMPVLTLLVQGDKDNSINLDDIVKSTEYCQKFVLKMVKDAGHFPHQENPEMFNREILKILKRGCSTIDKSPGSKSIMNRMFGAVSFTMKYGNSVLDSVQKRTKNGVTKHVVMRLTEDTNFVRK